MCSLSAQYWAYVHPLKIFAITSIFYECVRVCVCIRERQKEKERAIKRERRQLRVREITAILWNNAAIYKKRLRKKKQSALSSINPGDTIKHIEFGGVLQQQIALCGTGSRDAATIRLKLVLQNKVKHYVASCSEKYNINKCSMVRQKVYSPPWKKQLTKIISKNRANSICWGWPAQLWTLWWDCCVK